MIARASATIDAAGRVSRLTGRPPLSLRQVQADPADGATVCLVGAAAGPLAGDDLSLSLDVLAGSRGRLVATGATLAQGRAASSAVRDPGRLRTSVAVGAEGWLQATPPPLVACAGSRTEVSLSIDLDATASLDWRELVVLGRTNEAAGAVLIDWDVRRAGGPLLRQSIDLTDPGSLAWPGLLSGQKVLASELVVGDPDLTGVVPRTVVLSPCAVAQQLDESSVLLTVLAGSAAAAEADLATLRAALSPVAG